MQVRTSRRTSRAAGHGATAATAATAAALLAALVAGCTGGSGRPAAAPGSPSSASRSVTATPAEDVTLTLSVFGARKSLEAYDELGRAFTKNHPRITVEVRHAPDAETVLREQLRADRNGTPADVLLAGQEQLPALVEARLVQPVDALLEQRDVDFGDGYQRAALEGFAESARLQCMPHDVSPMVVYYNRDLVRPASVGDPDDEPVNPQEGWTWEQFSIAAHRAARGRAKGVHLEPALRSLIPFIWSAGADIVDDPEQPTSLTLSEGEASTALTEVLALVRDPQITPTREALAKESAVQQFKRGRLGMLVGDRTLTPRLRAAKNLDFDVMPLPSLGRVRTITSMTGYCLSSQTTHLEEAADLLAFAVGREGAAITASPGYVVPANLDVANSPAFLNPGQPPEDAFVFNDAVRRTESLPFVPEWPQVAESVTPQVERLFYAPVIDVEALLRDIDRRSRKVFRPVEQ